MNKEIENFIKTYAKEIENQNAALFIGAGFSQSSGYVNWKGLLKDIAEELELDIDKEYDLVSLAQYYCNKNNRIRINQLIKDNFAEAKTPTENHRIISRFPIFTYWTTNYDSLIEKALEDNFRIVDVKRKNSDLSLTRFNRDSIVYKMHGDNSFPEEAVILKEDYEMYYKKYSPFVNALNGDLISKTFLFLGFSFSDPNINYIFSKIKIEYNKDNVRQHYAIMKKMRKEDFPNLSPEEFEYSKRKFDFFINDLARYQIKVLLIDKYEEITEILKKIEKRLVSKTIFISGSAYSYSPFTDKEAKNFISLLSKRLIKEGYNIISGFGLGVGSEVIIGALEEIYMNNKKINNKRLLLRPFPQGILDDKSRKELWSKYRKDMISQAGVSIFLFGNKKSQEGKAILADGMQEEYEISKENKNILIPIGKTGYVAKKIYNDLERDLSYYGEKEEKMKEIFQNLDTKDLSNELIDDIIKILEVLNK